MAEEQGRAVDKEGAAAEVSRKRYNDNTRMLFSYTLFHFIYTARLSSHSFIPLNQTHSSPTRAESHDSARQWVGGAWRAAAELAVPWETVRDELRGQMFDDPRDKDVSPPTAAETAELLRRRRQMEKELALRVDPQVEAMRGQVRAGANKTDVRPLLRAATFKQLNGE